MHLETHLRAQRDAGKKLLVPYVTGGLGSQWLDVVRAVVDSGADAVEIGIRSRTRSGLPHDPGSVAARAGPRRTPVSVVDQLAELDAPVPLIVMTYYNIAARRARTVRPEPARESTPRSFRTSARRAGEWAEAARRTGGDRAARGADHRRATAAICRCSQGFVYGVALLGVTGEREKLAAHAEQMGRRLKAVTDLPVLLGVGISTPAQAAQAASSCDGVIVGSALVRRLLDGGGPEEARVFVASLRDALDADG
jgi:tryptophan synthase alpha chain